ncbi:MAG TPA: SOS response-associated peptidase [Thermodesulfobacteriota bacterium]|nr:SOS response-associated peptidase [Thermodesulfobacteriota bacterium]
MCGRYTQTTDLETLQRRFEFSVKGVALDPRYNLAPGQEAPIVVKENERVLKMMRWGLVPHWAKEDSIGYKLINARAETITQKPSFKESFKMRRCLILADGFYEWRKTAKKESKIPIRFMLKDGEPFAFAGLWDIWQKPDGDKLLSFTIITTNANDLVGRIHDRMPVILRREDEDAWLNTSSKNTDKPASLLKPYPSEMMDGYEVSTLVNSPKNDSPECIQLVASL